MTIANKATNNPGANPDFAREEYKIRAMPGKLRPAVAPEKAKGVLVIILAILVIGGLIGGEVYLLISRPDTTGMQNQIKGQASSIETLDKNFANQKESLDSIDETLGTLPSKEEFSTLKTTLEDLEVGQEALEEKTGLADSDQDGIPDVWEEKYGLNPKDRRDAKLDTDKDKLINFYEYLLDCDPTNPDTDKDGYPDGAEVEKGYNPKGEGKIEEILKVELIELVAPTEVVGPKEEEKAEEEEKKPEEIKDTDKDGMSDDWEKQYGLNPEDSADAKEDSDKDGLTNLDEYKFGADPTKEDTDGDGYLDGQEVSKGFNPAGPGKLGEIEKLEEEVKTIEEKTKEAENGILEK